MEGNENPGTAERGKAVRLDNEINPDREEGLEGARGSAGAAERRRREGSPERARGSAGASERRRREGSPERARSSAGASERRRRGGSPEARSSAGAAERRRREGSPEGARSSAGATERRRREGSPEGARSSAGAAERRRREGTRSSAGAAERRRREEGPEGTRRSADSQRRRREGEYEEIQNSRIQASDEAEYRRRTPSRDSQRRSINGPESVRNKDLRNDRKGPDLTRMAVNPMVIGAAAGLLLVLIFVIIGVRSCGSSHRSAAGAVKALVQASVDGNIGKMKDAYGISGDAMVDVQEALDAAAAYYQAHNVKKLEISSVGSLFEEGDYSYLYILYNLILDNDQVYPCIATYITQNIEEKYYVLTPSKVTEELSQKATDAYKKFMTTDTYKNYAREYDTFIKKNPGYEEKIAAKLA